MYFKLLDDQRNIFNKKNIPHVKISLLRDVMLHRGIQIVVQFVTFDQRRRRNNICTSSKVISEEMSGVSARLQYAGWSLRRPWLEKAWGVLVQRPRVRYSI